MSDPLLSIASTPAELGCLNGGEIPAGYSVREVPDIPSAVEALRNGSFSVAVVTMPQPGWTAAEAIEALHRADPQIPAVIFDRDMTAADAVRLSRLGARQCFDGRLPAEEYERVLAGILAQRTSRSATGRGAHEPWRQHLIGESRAMQQIGFTIELVAGRRCTVLISGETGTGKEVVARALHQASPRSRLPMVTVNCSAIPANLLESELFGHVKGAFTGAAALRIGRFEQAHRGTLFLDEIGDLPLDLQAKLLRALQEREFQRLGSSETIRVDVRIVAATNLDLREQVRKGRFREDLYYRLNVVPMVLPPLRGRASDIPLLVEHFVERICRLEDVPVKSTSPELLERLAAYPWPGNVRELENAVEMAIALSGARTQLFPADFPMCGAPQLKLVPISREDTLAGETAGLDFDTAVADFERNLLEDALEKTHGNKTLAARMLGLKRTTLLTKLRSLHMAEAFVAEQTA